MRGQLSQRLPVRGTGGDLNRLAATVSGDRDLLLEAVGNLVDNAVKFAPVRSTVTLSLDGARNSDGGWGAGVRLRVSDQGRGIPLPERTRVLQRFYRIENSRLVEGSGLGLSLVAAVAALHGFGLQIGDAAPGCVVEIVCPVRHERDSSPQRAAMQTAY